jgi:hypothetical protein
MYSYAPNDSTCPPRSRSYASARADCHAPLEAAAIEHADYLAQLESRDHRCPVAGYWSEELIPTVRYSP